MSATAKKSKPSKKRKDTDAYDIEEVKWELAFLIHELTLDEIFKGYGLDKTSQAMMHIEAIERGGYTQFELETVDYFWPYQVDDYKNFIKQGKIEEAAMRLILIEKEVAFSALSKQKHKLQPFPMSDELREKYIAWCKDES